MCWEGSEATGGRMGSIDTVGKGRSSPCHIHVGMTLRIGSCLTVAYMLGLLACYVRTPLGNQVPTCYHKG